MTRNKALLSALLVLFIQTITSAGEVIIVPSKGYGNISEAIVKARRGDTILVSDGKYKETLYVKDGLVIKAKNKHKAVVDAGGRGIGVTLGAGSEINGLIVTNATIGVFNKSQGTKVVNCQISQNWMTGIMAVRHLPQTNDNLIVFNRASGAIIWDARSMKSSMEHNTIAYNVGFGVYLGGTSEVSIENNTIAFNQKFGYKATKESEKSTIKGNNFYENLKAMYDYPAGNHNFDPQFSSPKVDMDFKPAGTCCAIRSPKNENLGVRFTK